MKTFERPGLENTQETLAIAVGEANKRRLPLVVASTRGFTAESASKLSVVHNVRLIVITHNVGFTEPGQHEFDRDLRKRLKDSGADVLTGTLPLRSLGTALRKCNGGSEQEIVNATLRMFCQGAKVCVEMAAMVADAGLVPPGEDIIAVAGTSQGADTACVVLPMPSNQFFNIRIREFLCKPGQF